MAHGRPGSCLSSGEQSCEEDMDDISDIQALYDGSPEKEEERLVSMSC